MKRYITIAVAVLLAALLVPAAAGAAKGNNNAGGKNQESSMPTCVVDHSGEWVTVVADELPVGEMVSFRYTTADGSTESWALGISTYPTKTVLLEHYEGERSFEFSATNNGRGKLKLASTCQG